MYSQEQASTTASAVGTTDSPSHLKKPPEKVNAAEATPEKILQLPSPQYVVYTDSELEQVRRNFMEMKQIGRTEECSLSKELCCRLVRNTITNMTSILRASAARDYYMYPTKEELAAMARRLVEYYPMLQDKSALKSWVSILF